jgi:hypothetical protein
VQYAPAAVRGEALAMQPMLEARPVHEAKNEETGASAAGGVEAAEASLGTRETPAPELLLRMFRLIWANASGEDGYAPPGKAKGGGKQGVAVAAKPAGPGKKGEKGPGKGGGKGGQGGKQAADKKGGKTGETVDDPKRKEEAITGVVQAICSHCPRAPHPWFRRPVDPAGVQDTSGPGTHAHTLAVQGVKQEDMEKVGRLQVQQLNQIYTNTDFCLATLCTWILTTRCSSPRTIPPLPCTHTVRYYRHLLERYET